MPEKYFLAHFFPQAKVSQSWEEPLIWRLSKAEVGMLPGIYSSWTGTFGFQLSHKYWEVRIHMGMCVQGLC